MTELLKTDHAGIDRAADILSAGGLVAFPTETVYGLGADARQGDAVAAIYATKGRPSFNPLIVHVADRAGAAAIGAIPDAADAFLADGWPAGLTLVVPLRQGAGLSKLVTAGLSSVALRVPKSDVAGRVLRAFGGPVAAPSANPSGRISPTTTAHVLSGLDGKIDAVLDGGATAAGLESTILGFEGGVHVLREGAFEVGEDVPRRDPGKVLNAPGQLASHYAPLASVRLNVVDAEEDEWLVGFGKVRGDVSLSETGDLIEAASRLFAVLHDADARGVQKLAIAPIPDQGLGRAINDRLRRAAAPKD